MKILESTVAVIGAIVVAVLFCQACPLNRPVPSPIDASDAASIDASVDDGPLDDDAPPTDDAKKPTSPCQPACDALKAAGCKEGAISDCARVVCQIIADPHFTHPDLTCLGKAKTPAAVRACGADCTL
jgi:hypothetical protein